MPQSSPETYVPRPDAEFSAWGGRFMAYVQANFAAMGLTSSDSIALSSARFRFQIGYRGHVKAKTAAAAAGWPRSADLVITHISVGVMLSREPGSWMSPASAF